MAIFSIPSETVGNAATRTARTAVADKRVQDLMSPPDPNPALTAAFGQYNQSRIGQRYKMGRGTNRGQIVNRGGEFAGRTPDETLGAIYNKSNPTPGSGPGGGLRTGSIQSGASQASGIDWLKANRTTGPELAAQERAVAPKMAFSKPAVAPVTSPTPAPIVPNQSQAIAPVAPKPALSTGGLTTGSLSAPAAPAPDNGVFNRLAANQAAQPRATAPVGIPSGAFQNQAAMKPVAGVSGPTGPVGPVSPPDFYTKGMSPLPPQEPARTGQEAVEFTRRIAGSPTTATSATPPVSKYEQAASTVTPGVYNKPAAPVQAQQESLDAFNKRNAAYEAKRQQELAFLKDPRYSGRAGQQGRTAAVSAFDADNPRPVFVKGGRGFNR